MRSGAASRSIDGALFGIKAAVLVIVVEALIRIGKRALKTVAAARTGGARPSSASSFLALPFPLIVAAAALIGYLVARAAPEQLGLAGKAETSQPPAGGPLAAIRHRRGDRPCRCGGRRSRSPR